MKQPFAALLRSKIEGKRIALRVFFFRRLGMRIKSDVQLGRIFCEWPNKITIGNKCIIEDNVVFKTTKPFSEDNCIEIGERVFIGQGCEFNINTKIKIGDDCLIASNTTFVDTGHEISINFKINQQPCTFEEIIVADDVWIGTHCVILKGVTIGKGSIIGAGSIVNKSIPEYQLWAGTPARFIRNRV
jgi:acetyltransferase-like isoleucine patch superfamily enzyme